MLTSSYSIKDLDCSLSRTLDQLLSKGYFYWVRGVELTGRASAIRNELLNAYRTSVLKHDQIGQVDFTSCFVRFWTLKFSAGHITESPASELPGAEPLRTGNSLNYTICCLKFCSKVRDFQLS